MEMMHGHETVNCFHLKEEIKKLIEKGDLKHFIAKESELKGVDGKGASPDRVPLPTRTK